jgi:hypothetical protein
MRVGQKNKLTYRWARKGSRPQAGWHGAKELRIPTNISLLPLPPRSPELARCVASSLGGAPGDGVLMRPVQRVRLLLQIARLDACHTRLVATDVVQHRLDNVRLYPDFSHAGRDGAADIVQAPSRHWLLLFAARLHNPFVNPLLRLRPAGESTVSEAKHQVAASDAIPLFEDGLHRIGHWHNVFKLVLGASRREHDQAFTEINFGLTHVAEFVASLSGQHQQPHRTSMI